MLTVAQAADILGVKPGTVRTLIARGLLPAKRFGPVWAIELAEAERYARERRPPGRPAKPRKQQDPA